MTEQSLRKRVQLAASRVGARLFRVNTGQAWVGRLVAHKGGHVALADARPIRMGLITGGSDLIGWDATGRFVAIELKTGRLDLTSEQRAFLAAVRIAGGLAGVARSPEDALAILAGGEASSTTVPRHGNSTPSRRR
jgi:hypothetical protein